EAARPRCALLRRARRLRARP
ncbi:MAG: hypothetical protein AVDCRST_MAG11-2801, partial [uncultured Gemmatimonadaceae bacterium]